MSSDQTTGSFELDLAAHEARRRAEVLMALGPDWDPVAVLEGEEQAYDMLYSGLDEQQQAAYELLVRHGVLPDRGRGEGGRRAA